MCSRQDAVWYDRQRFGQLNAQLNEKVFLIEDAIGNKVGFILRCWALFGSNMLVALLVDWRMALLLSPVAPIAALTMSYMGKLIGQAETENTRLTERSGAILQEAVINVRTVQSCNGQGTMVRRYREALRRGRWPAVMEHVWSGLFEGVFIFVLYAFGAVGV